MLLFDLLLCETRTEMNGNLRRAKAKPPEFTVIFGCKVTCNRLTRASGSNKVVVKTVESRVIAIPLFL